MFDKSKPDAIWRDPITSLFWKLDSVSNDLFFQINSLDGAIMLTTLHEDILMRLEEVDTDSQMHLSSDQILVIRELLYRMKSGEINWNRRVESKVNIYEYYDYENLELIRISFTESSFFEYKKFRKINLHAAPLFLEGFTFVYYENGKGDDYKLLKDFIESL